MIIGSRYSWHALDLIFMGVEMQKETLCKLWPQQVHIVVHILCLNLLISQRWKKSIIKEILSLHSLSVQFSSATQSCPTLCDPMKCSTPGLPVHHQLLEFTQTHVHQVSDAIQPSHPLSSPSPPAPNPFQHQSLFQWVNSSHEVAKVLELQL